MAISEWAFAVPMGVDAWLVALHVATILPHRCHHHLFGCCTIVSVFGPPPRVTAGKRTRSRPRMGDAGVGMGELPGAFVSDASFAFGSDVSTGTRSDQLLLFGNRYPGLLPDRDLESAGKESLVSDGRGPRQH